MDAHPVTSPPPPGGFRGVGRALRHRNYRLFFAGQTVSLIGSWLTRVATSWLVYRLTGSALMLGVVGFVGQLPTFFLAPLAGVWVDRWNRHRTLLVTQGLGMLQSGLLAYFALRGSITVTHVLFLSLAQGLINAVDMPARQTFVVEMIDRREDLPNAIALNSSMVNAARLLGPSIGGVLIASVGEGYCFAIDSVSYIAVIVSLLAMKVVARPRPLKQAAAWKEFVEGFRYVTGHPPIRSVLLLLALVSLMGMPHVVLMPVMATQVLHGDAHTLGFLMAASGLGALIGALCLASRQSVLGLGRLIPLSAAAFGVSLVAFSRSTTLWVCLPLISLTGLAMMIEMAGSNTLVQTLVDEDKRGRVMSFFAMAFFGTVPFGSLLAGSLAERIGAPDTLLLGGAVCILGALVFLRALPGLQRAARPLYVRRGLLAELPGDVQSAPELSGPSKD